jgi:hypothetical protein
MVVTHSSQTLGNNFVTHCFFFSGSWCDGVGELSVLGAFKPASSVLRERDLSAAKDSRVDISSEQLALCKLIFQLLTAATVRFFVIPPMYVLYIQLESS